MASLVILGMQWGDEGKGKIVDLLGPAFQVTARYQGGNNAGHTVRFGEKHFSLHLVPSGVLRPEGKCVLGNGMAVNPDALLNELRGLREAGVETEGRIFLSNRAHVILQEHVSLDRLREESAGDGSIGTTVRGIGPCYESKAGRVGLRVCDLYATDLEERLRSLLVWFEAEMKYFGESVGQSPATLADRCRLWRDALRGMVRDTSALLDQWLDSGENVLFEGAQGTLLDIDHGTYPFVTSSNATAGGVCVGTGVSPRRIDGVLGVLKAYTTRVGKGPMVGELENEIGEYLRKRGNEFGTTTGRPRRCAWLDIVAARYARRINGVDAIALTKLDVLDDLDEIPVITGYRFRNRVFDEVPADLDAWNRIEPVIETLPGWKEETSGLLAFEDLPFHAQRYVRFIEDKLRCPISLISSGPRREETILRRTELFDRLVGGGTAQILAARRP